MLRIGALIVACALLAACGRQESAAPAAPAASSAPAPAAAPAGPTRKPAPPGAAAYIIEPADGAKVSNPVRVVFGLKVGSSRVDLQACKLEYSIVSPK